MKTGMNLLLWTDHVTEPRRPARRDQRTRFDSVEIPIFDTSSLAPYERLGDD